MKQKYRFTYVVLNIDRSVLMPSGACFERDYLRRGSKVSF